jgi:hypothetical protein
MLLIGPSCSTTWSSSSRGECRWNSVGEQRREPLHPAEHGDVIDLHAALEQQLLHVPIREVEAWIPAHCDDDDLGREPEPGERRFRRQSRHRNEPKTSLLKLVSILPTLNATAPLNRP